MANNIRQRRRPEAAIKLNKGLAGRHGAKRETAHNCRFDELVLELTHGRLEEQLAALDKLLTHPDADAEVRRYALKTSLDMVAGRFGHTRPETKQLEKYLRLVVKQAVADEQSRRMALAIMRNLCREAAEARELPRLRVLREAFSGILCDIHYNTDEFSPNSITYAYKALIRERDRESAHLCAQIGCGFFPHDASLQELAAESAERLGRSQEAAERYRALAMMRPEHPRYFLRHAALLVRNGENLENAVADLDSFLERHPRSQQALVIKLDALLQMDQLEQVKTLADEAISRHPRNAAFYLRRAYALAGMGSSKQARADYTKANELDPKAMKALPAMRPPMMDFPPILEEEDVYSAHARESEGFFEESVQIPQQSFSDIGGLKPVIEQLRRHIEYPLKYPELSKQYGIEAGGGIILFGPPGCGKTMLARAAAGETGCKLINVNLSRILDKWVGNTEKAISMIFASARKNAPCILFFDEVDAIGRSRSQSRNSWEVSFVSQLLAEMDGISGRNEQVLLLGATNQPWNVDLALRRSGRLGKLLYVPPPDEDARKDILKLYLSRKPLVADDINTAELAHATQHHSADALRAIVEEAAAIPWLEAISGGKPRPIAQADLLAALAKVPPDLREWERMLERFEEFAEPVKLSRKIGFVRLVSGE